MYQQTRNLEFFKKKFSRVLLNGPPNSGKTTSLRTWPGPVIGMLYPKEKGGTSLPFTSLDGMAFKALIPDEVDVTKPQNWSALYEEMRQTTMAILAGKHGPVTTFFGDGIHKAYAIVLAHVTGGKNFTGEEFEPKLYSKAHSLFWEYIDMVLNSPVPHVVMTCWDGLEQDNPADQSTEGKKRKHVYPDLPGQAAKKIMGEFALVLNAGVDGVGANARYFWQTQPSGWVWGAGMKLPLEISSKLKLPREVEQNYSTLHTQIMTAIDHAAALLTQPTTEVSHV